MDRRRVVITGLGAVTPIGLTALESWQAVKNGVCGVAPITQFDPSGMKVKLAAEVKGFEAETLLGRQEAKRMGRFTQFAVVAAREAISDAGFDIKNADPDRCGVIISSGIGGLSISVLYPHGHLQHGCRSGRHRPRLQRHVHLPRYRLCRRHQCGG